MTIIFNLYFKFNCIFVHETVLKPSAEHARILA